MGGRVSCHSASALVVCSVRHGRNSAVHRSLSTVETSGSTPPLDMWPEIASGKLPELSGCGPRVVRPWSSSRLWCSFCVMASRLSHVYLWFSLMCGAAHPCFLTHFFSRRCLQRVIQSLVLSRYRLRGLLLGGSTSVFDGKPYLFQVPRCEAEKQTKLAGIFHGSRVAPGSGRLCRQSCW